MKYIQIMFHVDLIISYLLEESCNKDHHQILHCKRVIWMALNLLPAPKLSDAPSGTAHFGSFRILRGFAGEVSRVAQRGFVTIEGLLDEEIATAIHQETLETLLETIGDPGDGS